MKVINPSFEILDTIDGELMIQKLEKIGRVCYKSEQNITPQSASLFLTNILKSGHESVIEHEIITVKIICDRGVSHELVRHRIASYSQESTRYCNYSQDKFGNEITVIKPCFWAEESSEYQVWYDLMLNAEKAYNQLLALGAKAQEARSVLPNSLKTEIIVTMNIREWRHFFHLRTSQRSHPQMREIACKLLDTFKEEVPILFADIVY
jgi:thymidylate synthase (FAD)